MQEEFAGSYSALKDKHKFVGGDQATKECVQPLNPQTQALKWMKECQHSYTDGQLDFWLLLWPLANGGEDQADTWSTDFCLCGIGHWPLIPLYACLHCTLST